MLGRFNRRWFRPVAALGLALMIWGCDRPPDMGLPPGVTLLAKNEQMPNSVRVLIGLMVKGFAGRSADALARKTGLADLHGAGDDEALDHPDARRTHATLGRAATGLGSARVAPPNWVNTATEVMAVKRPHVAGERLKVAVGKGRVGYLQAIGVDASCTPCHGPDAALHPSVRQWIVARYPEGKSGAFRSDRLRGWYWVELDAPTKP